MICFLFGHAWGSWSQCFRKLVTDKWPHYWMDSKYERRECSRCGRSEERA